LPTATLQTVRPSPRSLLVAAVCTVSLSGLVGCGGDSGVDRAAGTRLFKNAGCGGCHTLAAARTKGTIGPNLDALKPTSEVVERQVTNGGNGMPPFRGKLGKWQISDLGDYIESVTAHSKATVASAFRLNRATLANCRGVKTFPCWEQAFGNLTYRKGPKPSLALLAARMRTNRTVLKDCHRIAHRMGAAALLRLKHSVGRAFAEGTAVCWSGYYHGILEQAFAATPRRKLAQKARTLCTDRYVQRSLFLHYQCVHGLGHGLMIFTFYDLPLALKTCDQLNGRFDQFSCTGGVFMENFTGFYKVQSKWLKSDDLLYPCDWVKDKYKYYCYVMVTDRILPNVHYDWRKTAQMCRRAEWEWRATCFQSFGRDVSGYAKKNTRLALDLCAITGNMLSECIFAVARDIVNEDAGPKRAARFCNRSPLRTRARCFEGIGTILGTLKTRFNARIAACKTTSRTYANQCLKGAVVANPPLLTPSSISRARRRQ
jgi:cbb3-type cytochrome c oxidase subunit III